MSDSEFHFGREVEKSSAGQRLDTFLLDFPYEKHDPALSPSRSMIQKWIAGEHVTVNSAVTTNKSYRVREGDFISIEVSIGYESELPPAEALEIPIVYRDKYLLVINKPPGIVSHPVANALTGTVVNFLHYQNIPLPPTSHHLRPGIVHRLDKNTSGLMVIACTDQAMSRLIEMIKSREVHRNYLALVYGNIPADSGTIEAPIGRHQVDRKRMAVRRDKSGREARTHYRVLKRYQGFTLVACKLDTGRTHQIRVHLSHMGYPVAADPVYGGRRAHEKVSGIVKKATNKKQDYKLITDTLGKVAEVLTRDNVHLLHAVKLEFPHPITGEYISLRAEPHHKFTEVLGLLEKLPYEKAQDEF